MSGNGRICVEIRRNPEEFDKKPSKNLANFSCLFFSDFCMDVGSRVYIRRGYIRSFFSCKKGF